MNKKIVFLVFALLFSVLILPGCRMITNTPQLMPNSEISSILLEYGEQSIEIDSPTIIQNMYEKYGQVTTNTRPGTVAEQTQNYGEIVLKVTTRTTKGSFSFRIVSRTFSTNTLYYFEKTKTNGSIIMIASATLQDLNYFIGYIE